MRRRYTWNIFQSIEYAGEQDQIKVRTPPPLMTIKLRESTIGTLFNFFPDFLQLYNFFASLMEHFAPASSESKPDLSLRPLSTCSSAPPPFPFHLSFHAGNLISHIFRKNEICCDTDWERYFSYSSVEVPNSYNGPRPTFPLTLCGVLKLVEAFKHKQVGA